jgi:hypothetical protein
MHKSATKCNETLSKWCKNKHGASKIMDTLETYHKSAAIGKPAPGKHHPAVEPPAGVEKPAAAGAEKPATTEPPPLLKMVATFDNYTTELDDGSNVLIKGHDIDVYVDRQKGIQVVELIEKFSENLLMGSHQKVKYMWYNRRICDYIEIGVNTQPNLDVALDKYGMGNHILFLTNVSTRADPEGDGLTEGNGNIPSSIKDWISPSKVGTRNFSPKNTTKVTLTDSLKRNRKLLCKRTSPRKNASAQSRAEWLMTTEGENTRKKSTRKKTIEEKTQSTTKKTTEENTPLTTKKTTEETTPNKSTTKKTTEETTPNKSTINKTTEDKTPKMSTTKKTTKDKTPKMSTTKKTTKDKTPKMSTAKKTTEENTPKKSTTKKTTKQTTPKKSTAKKTTKDKTPKKSTTKKTTKENTPKKSTTKKTTEENTPKKSNTKKDHPQEVYQQGVHPHWKHKQGVHPQEGLDVCRLR